jgi:hypothetical protein
MEQNWWVILQIIYNKHIAKTALEKLYVYT